MEQRTEPALENERVFWQLERALLWADGFALFILISPSEDVRRQTVDRLRHLLRSHGRALVEVELPAGCTDPLREIISRVPDDRSAVSVIGLGSCGSADSDLRAVAHGINLQRERWARDLDRPILLWVDRKTHDLLVQEAPDLAAWSRGIETLEPVVADHGARSLGAIRQLSPISDFASLPFAQAEQRLVALEDVLADLQAAELTPQNLEARFRTAYQVVALLHRCRRFREAIALAEAMRDLARREQRNGVLARFSVWLGLANQDAGQRREALAAYEEALPVYRELAGREPGAFLPNVAVTLNNLGNVLRDLGRREEALGAYEEALPIYRQLAGRAPGAFLPDVAMTLNNLGNVLRDLGRREEALGAYEEALPICRELAGREPGAFLRYLAATLNNLGAALRDLRRHEEALGAYEEALAIRRELAGREPGAFLPGVAMALNNLGTALSDLGRREEALGAYEEALPIYRELAGREPGAFLQYVAGTLNNLGDLLHDLGRREAARVALDEAIAIYRPLAAKHPQAFRRNLLVALGNRAKADEEAEGRGGPGRESLHRDVPV